jgi:predicted RNA binding protein YcfA (HicA-like mRNA interferase family)
VLGEANFTFCFHDKEEVGPAALAKIAKETGLRPEDL